MDKANPHYAALNAELRVLCDQYHYSVVRAEIEAICAQATETAPLT